MADKANITFCILWEDELRNASKLLAVANDMSNDDPGLGKAQSVAWAACTIALHGLTEDKSVVMMAARELGKRMKK